ncbi:MULTISPECIES: ASKHA domain-containing protein [Thermodesulfovibrio]|jgi:uncharacterized 2Fe-2S/4Fe-4S cluster protein (DUF4445 family)|uniref:ASKHA domain-containing protein n=1 Tax=Thermodesulfovibrio TaxID=28261 RepID=UPI002632784C|nr:ASKHA domain-containing protein [Thermodesulfovibrio sp.]
MPLIRTTSGEVFEATGKSILECLQINSIFVPASCGGRGICGRCKVKILAGSVTSRSFFGITDKERQNGYVLACQSQPLEDILIEIPEKLITVSSKISCQRQNLIDRIFKSEPSIFEPLVEKIKLSIKPPTVDDSMADFERLCSSMGKRLFISRNDAENLGDILRKNSWQLSFALVDNEIISFLREEDRPYALAIDIGTTTVVAALVDLEEKRVVDHVSCYNSQISYGDDVITRIIFAEENSLGLNKLRKAVVDDINALINALSVRHGDAKILYAVISGNTTMCHLFWGLNPSYIRQEPYTPVINNYPLWKASEGKLALKENVPVYTVPSVAGYVGGDIVSGVLASGIYEEDEVALFIDIGTNGEVVVGNKDWLVTASTSAGPCFEGSGISCGMRATEGAIEAFSFEGDDLNIRIIGNKEPIGICGSGMIDIVAELFRKGIVNQKGRLIKEASKNVSMVDEELRFTISNNCYISQSDIDNIIRAKAAIYAGISTLLHEVGILEKEIGKVYIAGGFGEFINIKNAISIGMLPNFEEDKFTFLGNTSLTGAILCLLSKKLKNKAEEIADKMTYIDLSRSKTFMDEYVSALFLPHTDIERFKKGTFKL